MKHPIIFDIFDRADEVRVIPRGTKIEDPVTSWNIDDGADYGLGDCQVLVISTLNESRYVLDADTPVELGPQGSVVDLQVVQLHGPRHTTTPLTCFRNLWLKPEALAPVPTYSPTSN